MNRLLLVAAGAGAVVALAAGCSSGSTGSTGSTGNGAAPSSGTPSSGSGAAATVKTASSPLGPILVDGSGRTLYVFEADTGTTSTCTGTCAALWPADTTTGAPQAGTGVSASMLGTSMRSDDHRTQVTFDGHPLYYFSKDAKPGDVNGEGVQGVWFVVSPTGSAVTSTPSQAPSPSGSGTGGSGGGGGYGSGY